MRPIHPLWRARAARPTKPHLGVLVVHGIGEQKQGEPLTEFGGPIVRWINDWLAPDPAKKMTGSATFTSSTLRPPELALETPAHALAQISTEGNGIKTSQMWLFAESWWSPQTLAPRVSPFLIWLITRGPWVLLLHLMQRLRIDLRKVRKDSDSSAPSQMGTWLKIYAATAVWLFVSLLLVFSWVIVSVIALIPIGYVRKRVYDVLLVITGVIGDSYVLLNDPIQRAAFGNATRKSLLWLKQRCEHVAVVAHSQGAAVARDVLVQSGAPSVDLFVTFGPGICKLDALSHRERTAPHDFLWCGFAGPLILLAVLLLVRLWIGGHDGFALWALPAIVGGLGFFAIVRTWTSVDRSLKALKPDAQQVDAMRSFHRSMRWRDFYASHDPVSNGSLSQSVAFGVRRIVSRKVRVLASLLADHTAYWTSRADFVPRVVVALDQCARSGLFRLTGLESVRQARGRFVKLVYLLSALRWSHVAALLLPPVLEFKRVVGASLVLRHWLDQLPVETVSGTLTAVDKAVAWIATLVAGHAISSSDVVNLALLALVVLVVLNVWRRILIFWWHVLVGYVVASTFRPSELGAMMLGQLITGMIVVAIGLVPLVLSLAWTLAPDLFSWSQLDVLLVQIGALTFLLFWGSFLAAAAAIVWHLLSEFRIAYRKTQKVGAALKLVEHVRPLVLVVFVSVVGGWWLLTTTEYTAALLPYAIPGVLICILVYAFAKLVQHGSARPRVIQYKLADGLLLLLAVVATSWALTLLGVPIGASASYATAAWLVVLAAVHLIRRSRST